MKKSRRVLFTVRIAVVRAAAISITARSSGKPLRSSFPYISLKLRTIVAVGRVLLVLLVLLCVYAQATAADA
jgi:hypothetical protein